ncbi:MAG: ferritin-like domain-containing protein [Pseudomonadota bacterium]
MSHWSLEDIAWDQVRPGCVDAPLLAAIKTAALVEANSADYVAYLHSVFGNDPEFMAAASRWGEEEAQHGEALGRWAEAIDPEFDFQHSLAIFRDGYQIPVEVEDSVRGSRTGELLARCVVESGTCSFYSAVRDATQEPVLKQICGHIAQDEAQHYQLFYVHMRRYAKTQPLSVLRRLQIAGGRIAETSDDELTYAYYSANVAGSQAGYARRDYAKRYQNTATSLYEEQHVVTVIRMVWRAIGFNPLGALAQVVAKCSWLLLRWRTAELRAVR